MNRNNQLCIKHLQGFHKARVNIISHNEDYNIAIFGITTKMYWFFQDVWRDRYGYNNNERITLRDCYSYCNKSDTDSLTINDIEKYKAV